MCPENRIDINNLNMNLLEKISKYNNHILFILLDYDKAIFRILQGYALYVLVCCSGISASNFCYKTTFLAFRPYCKREFERGPIIAQITSLLPTHYPYGSRIEERRRYMEHRITRTNPKNGKGNTDAIIVLHNIRFEICR